MIPVPLAHHLSPRTPAIWLHIHHERLVDIRKPLLRHLADPPALLPPARHLHLAHGTRSPVLLALPDSVAKGKYRAGAVDVVKERLDLLEEGEALLVAVDLRRESDSDERSEEQETMGELEGSVRRDNWH